MTAKSFFRKCTLAMVAIIFAGTYVWVGNPEIERMADYGSVGLNSIAECSPITATRNQYIFC